MGLRTVRQLEIFAGLLIVWGFLSGQIEELRKAIVAPGPAPRPIP